MRDMPAPRKSESAAGGAMQRLLAWPYRAVLAFLIWTGVRPWHLTVLSPVFILLTGWQIVDGNWLVAGLLLIVGSLLDVFDGSVARHRGEDKRSGAFMDSVLDRVSDMILFSCLFWNLAAQGKRPEAGLALLTLVVSLGVSQVRAEAEAVGVKLTEGLFQRLERWLCWACSPWCSAATRPYPAHEAGFGNGDDDGRGGVDGVRSGGSAGRDPGG